MGAATVGQAASDAVIVTIRRPLTWANAVIRRTRLVARSVRIEVLHHSPQLARRSVAIAQTKTDDAVFADPDRFDITRSPNPHLGFGSAGPHFCLGAHLARREITAMLRELLTRVPDIPTAGQPDYLLSSFINGIKHLPCEFG